MKKMLLSIGGVAAVIAPMGLVIACSNDEGYKFNKEKLIDEVNDITNDKSATKSKWLSKEKITKILDNWIFQKKLSEEYDPIIKDGENGIKKVNISTDYYLFSLKDGSSEADILTIDNSRFSAKSSSKTKEELSGTKKFMTNENVNKYWLAIINYESENVKLYYGGKIIKKDSKIGSMPYFAK